MSCIVTIAYIAESRIAGLWSYVSPSTQVFLGFSAEEWLNRGELWLEQLHPEDREQVLQAERESLETGTPLVLEYRLYHKDGRLIWCRDEGVWVQLPGTRSCYLQGVIQDVTELRDNTSLTNCQLMEERFQNIFHNAPTGIALTALNGQFLEVNPAFCDLMGYTEAELLALNFIEITHPEDLDRDLALNQKLVQGEVSQFQMEKRYIHKQGKVLTVILRVSLIRDAGGQPLHTLGQVIDITPLKQAKEQYKSIFENSLEGIFQTTPAGYHLRANPALAKIFGYDSPEELILNLTDLDHKIYVEKGRREEFKRQIDLFNEIAEFESQVYRKDGSIIWISENARSVRDSQGNILYYEGTVQDITERKQAEEKLFFHAYYSPLTNLPNRTLLLQRIKESIARSRIYRSRLFALFLIDLDRFKVINDSLGYFEGDRLLMEIGKRLENTANDGDTIAHLGGDEFAVLIYEVRDLNEAIQIAENLQTRLSEPLFLGEREVFVTASIGIALGRHSSHNIPYDRPEDVLRDADIALDRAKRLGKGRYEVFDLAMEIFPRRQLELEMDLRRAISREELRLYYQPIVSLSSGEIQGFEALLRWQHPQQGIMSPYSFLPLAEETGLIVPIGEWVLREACRQFHQWLREGWLSPNATISVNIAGQQFGQPDLVPRIQQTLIDTGLDAQQLRLEIVEEIMMGEDRVTLRKLLELRELGVELGIDDFGTGYSSLSRLHRFPIDILKVDRSFVMQLEVGQENLEIVRAIINLGLNLGMKIVAEGVETLIQLHLLKKLGCNFGQGYLFSRPVDSNSIHQVMGQPFIDCS